ncbi:hypothetical protein LZD49_27055 [Dyadobacter sp. CY261]|uniref:hypothetical protein n=1 Tax=Dyadobacter sp. CY261 TaxID=2907203 RepID=UPI001F30901D|nr:hypothetical protein [Dyadobacter sp. CY261]MCF0074172.1 hypothetical protein [Dyadobacter sp. CY261]
MTEAAKLKRNYQKLLDWYQYRAEENKGSQQKLLDLLAALDRDVQADKAYEKDVDDLESLKIIYETGIRRFESQVDRYKKLIDGL